MCRETVLLPSSSFHQRHGPVGLNSGKLGMEVGGVEDWAESAFYVRAAA